MKTIEKMQRAFKLYQILKMQSDSYTALRPGGIFGIAVDKDEYAKKWQHINFRKHFLECYLSGDSINWHQAKWLTPEQANQRINTKNLNYEHPSEKDTTIVKITD